MNRSHHHVVGAVSGLWLGVGLGLPVWQTGLAAGIAAATAPLPDIDNRRAWRLADRLIPDEALGHGGPMRHRGLLHFWGLPAALMVVVWVLVPGPARWAAWVAVAGWASHIAADFAVGAKSRYRGPGVPLILWWRHAGLGLHNGSVGDDLLTGLVAASGVWAAIIATGTSGPILAIIHC